jgi:alcohol dehydrogenase class IV
VFDWVFPRCVRFGLGALSGLPELVHGAGRRALIVTGRSPQRAARVAEILDTCGVQFIVHNVESEPSIEDVEQALSRARQAEVQFVVAIGGGSVLDVGKAVAGLLTNGGVLLDYLEVVGEGKPLVRPAAPFIAIPTTAGTGSEATRNAVLDVPTKRIKVSMRSVHLVPAAVILDPELTLTLPHQQTLASGLDALTQLLEAFVCRRANPLTDAVCREGLRRGFCALPRVVSTPHDLHARSDMLLAAFFSGIALANAGLGAAHGFAGPLGGLLKAPHGVLCAALIPAVVATNIAALRQRKPTSEALRRYAEAATLLTGNPDAEPEMLAQWLAQFVSKLQVPSLSQLGLREELIPDAIAKACRASSMKANPIELTNSELEHILKAAMNGGDVEEKV